MTIPRNKYQAYAAATQTVAKTKQIVLLYDGVIRFLQQAKEAIRAKRYEERYNLLIKASEVVSGLQGCLDFENGGEIARILYNFYASIDSRLFSIHHSNSIETCDELIAELKQMRDVWHEIDQTPANSNTASPSTNGSPPTTTAMSSDIPDKGIILSA
jgi:flagellar secretion chaperone FliS